MQPIIKLFDAICERGRFATIAAVGSELQNLLHRTERYALFIEECYTLKPGEAEPALKIIN